MFDSPLPLSPFQPDNRQAGWLTTEIIRPTGRNKEKIKHSQWQLVLGSCRQSSKATISKRMLFQPCPSLPSLSLSSLSHTHVYSRALAHAHTLRHTCTHTHTRAQAYLKSSRSTTVANTENTHERDLVMFTVPVGGFFRQCII